MATGLPIVEWVERWLEILYRCYVSIQCLVFSFNFFFCNTLSTPYAMSWHRNVIYNLHYMNCFKPPHKSNIVPWPGICAQCTVHMLECTYFLYIHIGWHDVYSVHRSSVRLIFFVCRLFARVLSDAVIQMEQKRASDREKCPILKNIVSEWFSSQPVIYNSFISPNWIRW